MNKQHTQRLYTMPQIQFELLEQSRNKYISQGDKILRSFAKIHQPLPAHFINLSSISNTTFFFFQKERGKKYIIFSPVIVLPIGDSSLQFLWYDFHFLHKRIEICSIHARALSGMQKMGKVYCVSISFVSRFKHRNLLLINTFGFLREVC